MGVGTVAAVSLALAVLAPASRDRGLGGAPLVELGAVAEAQGRARALGDGSIVARDEQVVFFVRASRAGYARITEDGAVVYPVGGSWAVADGESVPGGASPLAWRPDRPPGTFTYELEVCDAPPPSGTCGRDRLVLRWAP